MKKEWWNLEILLSFKPLNSFEGLLEKGVKRLLHQRDHHTEWWKSLEFSFIFKLDCYGCNWLSDIIASCRWIHAFILHPPASPFLSSAANMTFYYVKTNMFSRLFRLSLALLPGRLQPVLLCLSLRLYQPITSWLQVLNLGPGHQLAHYSTALNLPFSYSLPLSLFSSSPSTLLHATRYLLSLVLADLNNSIVPAVPEGSDDTNKPRFEIDFHSAPF